MNRILEQIIKNVLTEENITLGQEVLQPGDDQMISDNIRTPLNISRDKANFNTFDGFRVTLSRFGLRDEDPTTGEKSRVITPNEFQTDVILKLNGLRGTYLPMTSPDYVWVITTDLKTDDRRKPKQQRLFAKYYSIAVYIQTKLLPKTITNKMSGYVDTLRGGAMVFDIEKVNFVEWTKNKSIDTEPITLTAAPLTQVTFGQTNSVVRNLYAYFGLKELGYDVPGDNVFGCDLKGAIQQFQRENNIEVTGNYDELTARTAFRLRNSKYEFKHSDEIKQFANICTRELIANKPVITQNTRTINTPATGFTYGMRNNAELKKLQDILKKNLAITPNVKDQAVVKAFTKVSNMTGLYGPATRNLIKYLKKGLSYSNPNGNVIEPEFVDVLFKNLELKESINVIEQLNLQNFDVDAANTVTSEKPNDTPTKTTGDTKKKTTTPTTDKTKQTQDAEAAAKKQKAKRKYIESLIVNGIFFFEAITKHTLENGDWPEEYIYKLITKRLIGNGGNDAVLKTAYCDMIMRFANSKYFGRITKPNSLRIVNYVISRNGRSSTTVEYLRAHATNTPSVIKRLDDIFTGDGGDWLDFDHSTTQILRNRLNNNIFNDYQYDENDKSIPLRLRYTDSDILKKFENMYNTKLFGAPKEQFQLS